MNLILTWLRRAGATLLLILSSAAYAQDFPNAVVTIVVPYSASQIDTFARALAKGLAEEWKQAVIIDNRPGANEIVAADRVSKARADGYTIFMGTEAAFQLNPLLYRKLSYDPDRDLVPVSLLVKAPLVLLVGAGFPANSLKEFVDVAKSRSARPVTYGSPGVGGLAHLPLVGMAREQGISLLHVPYKGGGAVMQDLIAGHVDASLAGAGITEPQLKAGTVKALAISSPQRLPILPAVPTFAELGMSDIGASYFLALAVPASTPQPIVERIAAAAKKVVSGTVFRSQMLEPFGFFPVTSGPKEFSEYLKSTKGGWVQRVKDSGVQLDMP